MHVDLAAGQWDAVSSGHLIDPQGARWSRRSTRSKRSLCDQLIADGAPLVLYHYADGRLDWFDGSDAGARWRQLRATVTTAPRRRGDLEWTAGVWDCDVRRLVLLTGHC